MRNTGSCISHPGVMETSHMGRLDVFKLWYRNGPIRSRSSIVEALAPVTPLSPDPPRYFDSSKSPLPIAGWNPLSIPGEAGKNQYEKGPRGFPPAITPPSQRALPASRTYLTMDLILLR